MLKSAYYHQFVIISLPAVKVLKHLHLQYVKNRNQATII